MTQRPLAVLLPLFVLASCSSSGSGGGVEAVGLDAALASLSEADLMRHVKVLANDELEGRGPGTKGGELTVAYLIDEFEGRGLKPGNPDGTFVQRVPLMGYETTAAASFVTAKGPTELTPLEDFVAVTRLPMADMPNLEMVFCGYGTVAPEYDWNDFKDVDVRGKALVMLVNDPPITLPDDPSKLDESMFRGKAMTYYGRWTYKNEIAKEVGAAAVILVHETGPAGYPWEVVSGSWGREGFDIAGPLATAAHVPCEAWITRDVAAKLFEDCGLDFVQMKRAALSRDFSPVVLPGARANFDLSAKIREIESHNVVALVEGSHPKKKDELIVFTAHWDHLGLDPNREGDQIFNGALDNASGTAALIEMAEALMMLEPKPDRSVLFLAVTAEEKGLLGSKYYAANPLYPLAKTVANVNIDGLNPYGRTSDVVSIGYGFSTLDEVLATEAGVQSRTVKPDAEPEKGFYYRSDHFSFAKRGVPALYAKSGVDYVGRPSGWGQARRDEYTANDYHKPSDEIKEDWDMTGGLEDLELYLRIALHISQADEIPAWKPGIEFKAVREEMLRNAD
jgi:Zn-dependent M28 family amino/carboxypeptidase